MTLIRPSGPFSREREKGNQKRPPASGRWEIKRPSREREKPIAYLNKNADITKLNISTSSEALTTARVVATEVPSMVGSAWKPT